MKVKRIKTKNKIFTWKGLFAVLLVATCLIPPASAQTYSPAMDYASMLNVRFYENSGGFMVETLPLFFPPGKLESLEFEIATAQGKSKFRKNAQAQKWQQFSVVDGIRPSGGGNVGGLPTGDYRFQVKLNGEAITSVPFTINVSQGDDPFNPKKTITRQGPWSQLGYITDNPEQPKEAIRFNWWANIGELPGGQGGKVVALLKKEGVVLADSRGFFVSKKIWQTCSKPLRKAGSNGRQFFTMADLLGQDGSYQMVLESAGKTLRTYKMVVAGGKLQHHPRSALGYQPQADYIVPKVIGGKTGDSSGFIMLDAYWLDAS